MIEIGTAYFECYPDRAQDRNKQIKTLGEQI